jgi:TonB family protein
MLLFLASGGAAQGSGDRTEKVSSKVKAPVVLEAPEAEMPATARSARRSGVCVISLVVDANGRPQNPRVVRCTDAVFADNSLAAVMKYRFAPARKADDGRAVPAKITVEINFSFAGRANADPPATIEYAFYPPPRITTTNPDADGVYPLSKRLEQPKMVDLVSQGFAEAALPLAHGTACDLTVVLDAKGKPQSATVSSCDQPALGKPAVESIMKSKFKPAKLNGSAVAVRLRVRLTYAGTRGGITEGRP